MAYGGCLIRTERGVPELCPRRELRRLLATTPHFREAGAPKLGAAPATRRDFAGGTYMPWVKDWSIYSRFQ